MIVDHLIALTSAAYRSLWAHLVDLPAALSRRRGNAHRRPIPDLIIAATAELHGAEVLHVGQRL